MIKATFKWDYFMNFHEIVKFPGVIPIYKTVIISLVRDANRVCEIESVTGKSDERSSLRKSVLLFWFWEENTQLPCHLFLCIYLLFCGSESVGSWLMGRHEAWASLSEQDRPSLSSVCYQTPKGWSLGLGLRIPVQAAAVGISRICPVSSNLSAEFYHLFLVWQNVC